MTMSVVCAPNAFKGSLTAADAAAAMAAGVVRNAGATATALPVADGGDGTLDVLLAAAGQRARIDIVTVTGPLGDAVAARLGWTDATTAIIELAEAAGLRLVGDRLDPLRATTFGVGQMIAAAVDGGARRIIVGVGGSATTDGGLGILRALGAKFADGDGNAIPDGSGATAWVVSADLAPVLRRLAGIELLVAVDVNSPLYGGDGAAQVFGPQKGADPRQVAHLDSGLRQFAAVVEAATGRAGLADVSGAGAAGGSAFGLAAVGARIVPGAVLICDECRIDAALATADLVITGEGALDGQTARGKAPAEVARRARRFGVACHALAGRVDDALPDLFDTATALGTLPGDGDGTRRALSEMAAAIVAARI